MHKHISHYGLRQKNAPSEFDRHAQVQSSQGDVDHVGFLGAGDNVRQHDWVILGWNVRLRGMRDGAGIKTCQNMPKHATERTSAAAASQAESFDPLLLC
jgi:hypothetical protein